MTLGEKKFYKILGVMCVIVFLSCINAFQFADIRNLKKEIKSLQEENVSLQNELNEYKCTEELKDCPICDKEVKVKQYDDSFVIECEKYGENDGCGLRTGYYDSKIELIKDWNKED